VCYVSTTLSFYSINESVAFHYQRRQYRSAWVRFSSPSVCLFVSLFVCPQHNSKTNDPKVFKLDMVMTLRYPIQVTWFWVGRSKVNVRVRVNSNTAWVRTLWVPSSFFCFDFLLTVFHFTVLLVYTVNFCNRSLHAFHVSWQPSPSTSCWFETKLDDEYSIQVQTQRRPLDGLQYAFCTLWPCDLNLWPFDLKPRLFPTPSMKTLGVIRCWVMMRTNRHVNADERFTHMTANMTHLIGCRIRLNERTCSPVKS